MFKRRALRLLLLLLAMLPALAQEHIPLDVSAPSTPFPHFWEETFGSGRAILSLRDSYRRDLRQVRDVTGMKYVRFHGIFLDEVGLYDEDASGKPIYNFSYIDQIYDGLLEAGVRPFVELSFMPHKLAAREAIHPFWYRQNVSPPKDPDRWEDLLYQFAQHLSDRYGEDEVSQWYFEVWNEPNIDFWAGEPKQATYFELYDRAARAVKRASPRFRVGGPATAQAAWVGDLIRHCTEKNVPLDFVSTHVYASDTAQKVLGTNEPVSRKEMVARAVRKVYDEVKRSSRPGLPIHWSEYNASSRNQVEVTDSAFMGPWLANNIRLCDGLTTTMSYWTFSDVFEERGVVKRPFYGGFGLITAGNIPKASFNAFRLLHLLGERRLRTDSENALVTERGDGAMVVALWNYADPGASGPARRFTLDWPRSLSGGKARIYLVDREHGSSLEAWNQMGHPDFPSREQQRVLRRAAELPAARVMALDGAHPQLSFELQPHSLMVVELLPPDPSARFRLSQQDRNFLEDLEHRAFRYFWEHSDPNTGLTRDRARTTGEPREANRTNDGSIAATGFALSSYCIAANEKWVTPAEARERTRNTLRFFADRAPREHGWFYHWMNIVTGERIRNSEISSIDTALLMGGVLTVRQCFHADPEIVELATRIYERIDFPWMLDGDLGLLSHGWRPETGWIRSRWNHYSEHSIIYLLGIGSPTHPLPPESWYAWERDSNEYAGYRYIGKAPLFTHQYSQAWIDMRGLREDRGSRLNYFENTVNATRAHRQFCIDLAKEFPGYSETIWGITSSDSAKGYVAWGGPPRHPRTDGTVVPCAAGGALMFTPDIALPAVEAMRQKFGDHIYGPYGFADAFNPNNGWVSPDVIGIDVGITLLSAENLRTGNVWNWFMQNPEISHALALAGFRAE